MTGKHRKEDERKPVGEGLRKITKEQIEKAKIPPPETNEDTDKNEG